MRPRTTSAAFPQIVLRLAPLGAVVLLGAILRFYGLKWGLPGDIRDYSYHPDEFLTIGAAFGRVLADRTLDTGFYNYPSLYIYSAALAVAVGFAYGAAGTFANVYLAARTVTALAGTAAVAVTYWAGRVIFGRVAGIIAALVMCVAPIHAQHSHFATVDVPCTLLVAAALGFAGLILQSGSWKSYLLGGAMAGLAAGTKYNAGLVLLSVIAAHLLRGGGLRRIAGPQIWAAVGCAVVAFVISTPGSVMHPDKFLHGLTYELRHAAEGHGLVFVGTGSGFLHTLTSSMWYGLGPQLVLCVPAVVLAVVRRQRYALAVLAFAIPYFVLISLSQVRFARYALPMFPGIAVITGWFVVEVWSAIRGRVGRLAWAALCGLVFCWTLAVAVIWTAQFGMPDPRDQAARWITSNIPKGAVIGVIEVPWFYSPPLSKELGFGTLNQRQEAMQKTPYRLRAIPVFHAYNCDWGIVSDYETSDALRLKANTAIPERDRRRVSHILSQLRALETQYVLRRQFGGMPAVTGFADPPHDMRYVRPELSIYELKK